MSVTTSKNDVEVLLAILNTAGMGHAFYGQSDINGGTDLWFIRKAKKSKQEVIAALQATPAISSVSLVMLSNPVKLAELHEVRELFTTVGWDASNVSDADLSLFIEAKRQGKYTYYIDHDFPQKRGRPVQIRIRPAEEHPDFSPIWLTDSEPEEEVDFDKELTIDDIVSVTVTSVTEVEPPPPPPIPNAEQET